MTRDNNSREANQLMGVTGESSCSERSRPTPTLPPSSLPSKLSIAPSPDDRTLAPTPVTAPAPAEPGGITAELGGITAELGDIIAELGEITAKPGGTTAELVDI